MSKNLIEYLEKNEFVSTINYSIETLDSDQVIKKSKCFITREMLISAKNESNKSNYIFETFSKMLKEISCENNSSIKDLLNTNQHIKSVNLKISFFAHKKFKFTQNCELSRKSIFQILELNDDINFMIKTFDSIQKNMIDENAIFGEE